MKFKTPRIEEEYSKLKEKNEPMRELLVSLDAFTRAKYSKEIVLTHLFRTDQEQIQLYSATDANKRPARSPHQDWKAVDIRSKTFTKEEQDDMCSMLNTNFKNNKTGKVTAFVHTIAGGAEHFHIQVLG
jgi:ATP-dependent exoDNAse (exonuclease V) beta subunit